jgi:hypothetical protein
MQNKKLRFVFVIGIFLISPKGRADMVVGVGAGALGFDYAEKLDLPAKSTQHGTIPHFQLYAEEFSKSRRFFSKQKVQYASGTLTYDGSSIANNTPIISQDPHSFFGGEFLIGARLAKVGSKQMYVYGGADYRIWNRDLSNPKEVYHLLRLPFGLRLQPEKKQPFSFSFDVSARPLVKGDLDVTMSAQSGYDPKNISVTSAWGVRAEMPIRLIGHGQTGIDITPWYEALSIGQGPMVPATSGGQPVTQNGNVVYIYEPASTTHQWGVQLTAEFRL